MMAFARRRMVGFFTAPQRMVADVFIPWISLDFPDSKRTVSEARHHPREIRSTTRFHFFGLASHRIFLCIVEDAGRRRLAPCSDRIASGDADRTRGICV